MKPLQIGKRIASIPIIQGGMGVGVSRSSLAGAVAKEGGIGVISTAQIGYDEENFEGHENECNLRAIDKHIARAKEIAQGAGLVGVNIMVALKHYKEHVTEAVRAKADLIIVEGPKAGGHLGFSREQLAELTPEQYDDEIRNIIACTKEFGDKHEKHIPVVVAGGIFDRNDVVHALSLGAEGVQVASRFVATYECDASEAYKDAYIWADEEDVMIVQSPVGMPGRALRNVFMQQVEEKKEPITKCYQCLEHCNPAKVPYCITKALVNAVKGDLDHGLIFCGANVGRIKEMMSVHDLMQELVAPA